MDEPFNRSQLVALVQRLLQMDYHNEEEADQIIMEVQRHVLDPQVIDYIFWTDEGVTAEKAAEEIVDRALAYQPIIATWSLDQ
ncbi:hypothetical protein E7T06_07405 [Deinococcus sp. Arct2-2]|uniref:hypothetical protein n=1 Tax=Deinococcus sp. Arct2-2 TaxID=2568653 RepID=UPI0010A3A453|nr:hypothetical protein [Deinococcus sp. Arct2-2]THF70522.1 hypothetical protein E7T06_07405 [Deinococcus sp. Arct2-2]